MPMSHKQRSFISQQPFTFETSKDKGKTWKKAAKQPVDMGTQYTESEGHSKNKNGSWSGGGPFYTCRRAFGFPTRSVSAMVGSEAVNVAVGTPFESSMIPDAYFDPSYSKFRSTDLTDLDPDGATAISSVAPTNPNSELATNLGEIYKDGLPSLPGVQTWKQRTNALRGVASEFLNAQFGWLPLLDEVKNTSNGVRHYRDILSQYNRDSGRNVRRTFEFPVEEHSESRDLGLRYATAIRNGNTAFPAATQSIFGPGRVTQTIKVSSKKWFVGSFTYALPDRGDSWSAVHRYGAEADHLLGLSITPDVLWELTPWSWAVDWFSNASSVINNVTNFALQGLVMRYGYIMEERSVVITNQFTSGPVSPFLNVANLPPSSLEIRSKVRGVANPFGFGLSWEGLSPTQLAITAALGITRLR